MGFPTQVQEEKQASVSLDSRVARPVRGWLQPSLGRKPGHGFVCIVCVFSGCQLFPREVLCQSSKSDLADPREKEIYLHLGKETRAFQRQYRGYRAGAKAILASFLGPRPQPFL